MSQDRQQSRDNDARIVAPAQPDRRLSLAQLEKAVKAWRRERGLSRNR